jgi:hypothetical protein
MAGRGVSGLQATFVRTLWIGIAHKVSARPNQRASSRSELPVPGNKKRARRVERVFGHIAQCRSTGCRVCRVNVHTGHTGTRIRTLWHPSNTWSAVSFVEVLPAPPCDSTDFCFFTQDGSLRQPRTGAPFEKQSRFAVVAIRVACVLGDRTTDGPPKDHRSLTEVCTP